jgi:hypothetical protein
MYDLNESIQPSLAQAKSIRLLLYFNREFEKEETRMRVTTSVSGYGVCLDSSLLSAHISYSHITYGAVYIKRTFNVLSESEKERAG